MKKRHKLAVRMLFLFVFLIGIVVPLIFAATKLRKVSPRELFLRCVFAGYVLMQKPPPMPPPSEVFRQHVLDPIPESVTNIKADQPKNILGYRYTLRFNINRVDLALLIDSRPFERVWNVKYKNGYLSWEWDPPRLYGIPGHRISIPGSGVTIILYHQDGRREPEWFKLKLWDNPEAYVFRKIGNQVNIQTMEDMKAYDRINTQVLLYNEKEDEAYFIVSSLK